MDEEKNEEKIEEVTEKEIKEEIVPEESKNVQDEVEPKQDIVTNQKIEEAEETEANEKAEEIVDNSNTDDNAETEIEETKEVDIKEVNANVDENNLTPGDILINLAKERSNGQENVQVKDESYSFEEKFNDMYAQIFGKDLAAKKEEEQNKEANAQDIISSNMNIFEEDEEINSKIPYKFIGIAFDTYIILEIEKELYILDQHAAHERIMYEKVKKNY